MLRFGQSGQMIVEVVTPRQFLPSPGMGELRQTLTWRSTGAWQLIESIAYRGVVGSETTTRSPGLPAAFASSYATLVTQIHGAAGLDLFIEDLDPSLDPTCDPGEDEARETPPARVTLRIQDEIRGEERSWTRCAKGPLGSLDPAGSGPDIHASRVIQVSRFVHDRTLGDSATSVYNLSIPFATLDQGAKPGGEQDLVSRVFFGGPEAGDAPAEWRDFWDGTPMGLRLPTSTGPRIWWWLRRTAPARRRGACSRSGKSLPRRVRSFKSWSSPRVISARPRRWSRLPSTSSSRHGRGRRFNSGKLSGSGCPVGCEPGPPAGRKQRACS